MDVLGSLLEVNEATYRYSASHSIGPLTLSMPQGAALGLIGANGSGKTTLLRMLTGLLAPTSGSVAVLGQQVTPNRLPSGVAAMIEEPTFLAAATGRENLLLACDGRPQYLARVDDLLSETGLAQAADVTVNAYSQGMRQRLGIARTLLGDPDLLILDEPTNGLDPHGIAWLRRLTARRLKQGKSLILASHMLHEVESVSTHVCVLWQGAIVACGDTEATLKSYRALEELYFELLPEQAYS